MPIHPNINVVDDSLQSDGLKEMKIIKNLENI
jgi:hypothetical protein